MRKYCPKCHREAYRIEENGDQIRVIQGGSTTLNISKSSRVSMSLTCPRGHPVKLEIKPEEVDQSAR